jgi:hypothetical protein
VHKPLAPSRADACNPYCKRTRPGRGTNTKAAGFPFYACLPPDPPPFVLRLASTHLGWGTRRQFTHRSRDPPGSKRRHVDIVQFSVLATIVLSFICRFSKHHFTGEVLPNFLLTIVFFAHRCCSNLTFSTVCWTRTRCQV